jgi:hypothetical protein
MCVYWGRFSGQALLLGLGLDQQNQEGPEGSDEIREEVEASPRWLSLPHYLGARPCWVTSDDGRT